MNNNTEEDIYYELKKNNAIMWMIFGTLLVIAGILIATLPYISSYTKGTVEIQSTKVGTYVLTSPNLLIFGAVLMIIGFMIIIDGAFKYLLQHTPRTEYTRYNSLPPEYQYPQYQYPLQQQQYVQQPVQSPSQKRYHYTQESPPTQQPNLQPQTRIKKKRAKTTPDGRPIYKKKKLERDT